MSSGCWGAHAQARPWAVPHRGMRTRRLRSPNRSRSILRAGSGSNRPTAAVIPSESDEGRNQPQDNNGPGQGGHKTRVVRINHRRALFSVNRLPVETAVRNCENCQMERNDLAEVTVLLGHHHLGLGDAMLTNGAGKATKRSGDRGGGHPWSDLAPARQRPVLFYCWTEAVTVGVVGCCAAITVFRFGKTGFTRRSASWTSWGKKRAVSTAIGCSSMSMRRL